MKERLNEILEIIKSRTFFVSTILNVGIFSVISSVIYSISNNEKWYSRFVVSIVCFAFYTLIKQIEEIINILKSNDKLSKREKLYS